MKKFLSMFLAVLMICSCVTLLASCDNPNDSELVPVSKESLKIGFIFLHDDKSTYDKNFIDAAKAVQEKLGLRDDQVILETGISEEADCYDKAADLVDQGCHLIFADSFGHEQWLIKAAKEFKNVQFCHATGVRAHTENLPNFHNAFASIYEGRYLAGVAAGLKLNEMIANGDITEAQAKMGYVGAYAYAEVISGYTSFYLGAKSVCPSVTMEVDFTNEWYHVDYERNKANALIDRGCVLISQHADSLGAPGACEAKGVPNVSYNGSTIQSCPNTFIVSSRINWAPYFEYMINCVINGEPIATDWCGTISTGSVVLTDVNTNVAAEGTAATLEEIKAKLVSGEISVFDTDNFTVNGEKLTSYMANVDDDAKHTPDTEAIKDGIFEESKHRSAPYFDFDIDGIIRLDKAN